ncbi:MAG: DNA polymerase III subunit gamma/tau, partial [Gammaproteobacteria bacterium]|nr:DNA polymerase III subunit gamma/tau [Gammaproteobacteria bacterium]
MTYQVLARKWRPKTFADLIGQDIVVRTLTHALTHQRLHHAYLFTGTRGVGKTTLGRLIAKCMNCEQGISPTPCGQCSICLAIDAGHFVDLIEVDAASRTKVEDTRDLLDNVQYAPAQGRFKIYLIDEVHMLSGHSFNALLKTLEEPPSHVKFLFATTDPDRLPDTVLSRCIQFHLKNMAPDIIAPYLAHILQEEKINFEQTALDRIAYAAEGSMRDALSLLDQAIAFGQGALLEADVKTMLGSLEHDDLMILLEAIAQQDAAQLAQALQQLSLYHCDYAQAAQTLLSLLHHLAL